MKMQDIKKFSVIDKEYRWPDPDMANASGDCTRSSKLIAESIRTLGEVIHDFAKIVELSATTPDTEDKKDKG
jgi:hypothetical protein